DGVPGGLLFGRVQELDALKSSVLRAINNDRPAFILVSGPAGIGKTRLRTELTKIVHSISRPPRVFSARAEDNARSTPFAFLRRLLRFEARIQSDDPVEVKRTKLLDV